MKLKPIIVMVAIVLAGTGILIFRNAREKNQLTDRVSNATESAEIIDSDEATIEISNFSFKSDIVKIRKGTKVTWTNKDSAKHTVTSDEGDFLDSPLLGQGESYDMVFNEAGTYRYHCTPHPNMLGAVVVVE
jgi:amicyanin